MSDLPEMLDADDFTDGTEWEKMRLGIAAWDDYRDLWACALGEWEAGDPNGYGDQMALDAMACLDDFYRLMRVPVRRER